MTNDRLRQNMIRQYKDEIGVKEVDMHAVARFAIRKGWKLPAPIDPIDRLAREFSQAARIETRYDEKTGRPYRANHAFRSDNGTSMLWVDIDEAPRMPILKSLVLRREQMVNDGLHLTLDVEHWNRINPSEEPIQMPMDFTDDVEWRKNAPDDKAS